jgi:hypothetical protein
MGGEEPFKFSLSLCWFWRRVGKRHVLGDYGMQIMGGVFEGK